MRICKQVSLFRLGFSYVRAIGDIVLMLPGFSIHWHIRNSHNDRFQNQPWPTKVWRYRWMLVAWCHALLKIMGWAWNGSVCMPDSDPGETAEILWSCTVSEYQYDKMKWYYDIEELEDEG